jgi:hypothetical protein
VQQKAALALVLAPSDRDVMRQPPRPPGTPLIGGREWRGLSSDAAAMAGGTLGAYLWAARRYGYGPRASALAMTSLTFAEALYVLACRARVERPGGAPHRALPACSLRSTTGRRCAACSTGRRWAWWSMPSP